MLSCFEFGTLYVERICMNTSEQLLKYRSSLLAIASKMLDRRADAEDIVQDILVKWVGFDTKHIENPEGYLRRSLVNRCLNFIRDQRTVQLETLPENGGRDVFIRKFENLQSVKEALKLILSCLNPSERAIFLLREVFAFSHKEIAEWLDISEENSRQHLSRAKRKLKKLQLRFEWEEEELEELYTYLVHAIEGKGLKAFKDYLYRGIHPKISQSPTGLIKMCAYQMERAA